MQGITAGIQFETRPNADFLREVAHFSIRSARDGILLWMYDRFGPHGEIQLTLPSGIGDAVALEFRNTKLAYVDFSNGGEQLVVSMLAYPWHTSATPESIERCGLQWNYRQVLHYVHDKSNYVPGSLRRFAYDGIGRQITQDIPDCWMENQPNLLDLRDRLFPIVAETFCWGENLKPCDFMVSDKAFVVS